MSISMIGIDHSKASVDIRAKFSFTKKRSNRGNEKVKRRTRYLRMHYFIHL